MKWRKIPNSPYKVSDTGQVMNGLTGKLIKSKICRNGYEKIILRINGKPKTTGVHRLVATAFIPNPLKKPECHHMDGNKLNNQMYNLQWCDAYDNRYYSRKVLKHSHMVSFKKIETMYKDNKHLTLNGFINKLKRSLK
jgi:hypothetical protein